MMKKFVIISLDLIVSLVTTGFLLSTIGKYMDYAICHQTTGSCGADIVGCVPCSSNFSSEVFILKWQYSLLLVFSFIFFVVLTFVLYTFTKKYFKK